MANEIFLVKDIITNMYLSGNYDELNITINPIEAIGFSSEGDAISFIFKAKENYFNSIFTGKEYFTIIKVLTF